MSVHDDDFDPVYERAEWLARLRYDLNEFAERHPESFNLSAIFDQAEDVFKALDRKALEIGSIGAARLSTIRRLRDQIRRYSNIKAVTG